MIRRALPVLTLAAVVTAGCSHPISKALREQAEAAPPFPAIRANPQAFQGTTVVWGGEIVQTVNRDDGTDIIVLETPLNALGEPSDARESRGRFILRTPDFLDPAVYKESREVTAAGDVVGAERKPLGQTQYTYPVVRIRELHLWEPDRYYDEPHYRIRVIGGWGHWYHPYWHDPWYCD
ncbi:MAG: Slp family lipoprotein [Planctomycetota bacterium]